MSIEALYLMALGEVAEKLGVHTNTVRRLVDEDEIKGVRIAGRVMVPSDEVERVLKEGAGSSKRRKQRELKRAGKR